MGSQSVWTRRSRDLPGVHPAGRRSVGVGETLTLTSHRGLIMGREMEPGTYMVAIATILNSRVDVSHYLLAQYDGHRGTRLAQELIRRLAV